VDLDDIALLVGLADTEFNALLVSLREWIDEELESLVCAGLYVIDLSAEDERIGAFIKCTFATEPKNTILPSVVNCIVIILPVDFHEPGGCIEVPAIVTMRREDVDGPS